jgi:hypothetical protein
MQFCKFKKEPVEKRRLKSRAEVGKTKQKMKQRSVCV